MIRQMQEGQFEYDSDQWGKDDDYLEKYQPEAYCLKICNKIGQYFNKTLQVDLIHMDVKFFIDENGKLILNYCKNIWIRIKDNN